MGKLIIRSSQLTRALEGKLGLDFRSGSERSAWYCLDGKKILRVTIPTVKGGGGTILPGTANSIRNQLSLSRNQLRELAACPMSGTDYETVVRQKMAKNRL